MSSEIKPNEPTPSSAASVPSWAVHLPAPQSNPAWIEQSEVEDLIKSSATKAGVDFLIVDVRRNDLENYLLKTAVNVPAQTFHQTLPTLVSIWRNIPLVIFYCGSCGGRGPRCASWYQDALNAESITTSEARILTGGVKAWVAKYGETSDLVQKA
ncbi:hypothetical protein NLI96_g9338 [Meripilus lineatus]|uniref:Rhodanese domain-containing protein n=1 Tax=Meripilus lineatus TaxID=2056292 RepID=A0AAD5V0B0_9APHY|nr:hypothetical protein NLI96_g9338 [Physisporinus lineatus]